MTKIFQILKKSLALTQFY